ncbi:MAG: TldD/PmbA family protein [bacterium]
MEEIIKKLVSNNIKGDVFFRKGVSISVSFDANRLKSIDINESSGVGLRVIINGKIGYSSQYGAYDVNWLFEKAIATTNIDTNLKLPEGLNDKDVFSDRALESISVEELVRIGKDMIERVLNVYPDVLCSLEFKKDTGETIIRNTEGIDCKRKRSILTVGMSVNRIKGTDMLEIYEEIGVKELSKLDTDKVTSKVIETLDASKEITKVSRTRIPVIFTPKAVYVLLLPIVSSLNGKIVVMGASPLRDKIGEKTFDEQFSLIEDPSNRDGLATTSFDDEGVPTSPISLVENGVVSGFYFDLHTASLMGKDGNGHGFRSGLGQPSPGLTNLIILAGDKGIKEIISSLDEVLIIDQMMGVGQGNVLSGEFSVNVHLGYLYRKGELVGRVKDTMVAGNAYSALSNVLALSRETEWVEGTLNTPYICIPELTVVSKV